MKIAIAGGGISGLTFMNYLQRAGADVTLFEKKESFQEKGSGILLGINAMKILRDLGLEEKIIQRGQVLKRIAQTTTEDDFLARMNTEQTQKETSLPTVCISRVDLHSILSEKLDKNRIRLATEVTSAESSGERLVLSLSKNGAPETSNEKERTFDLLIGADGIHSKTREVFYGKPELRYAGYTCWRFIIEAPKELNQAHAFEYVGSGRRLGIFPQGQNKIYCFATLNAPAGDENLHNISKERFGELFSEFPQDVLSCIKNLKNDPEARLIHRDIADLKKSILHVSGLPVLLAGDAGHATTPNMGQGAAMGIEDAYLFAALFQKNLSPENLAKEFALRRKKRIEKIRAQSKLMGKISQTESRLLAGLRNTAMRLVPQELTRKSMQSLLLHPSVFPGEGAP